MIEVRKQVPGVYYNESRDFQLIGRIFEVILNYLKTNNDCTENTMDTNLIDDKLVNLLAKTVGFESRHEYDVNNLKIICGCFSTILKYKGTKRGIDMAISSLLNSRGVTDNFESVLDYDTRTINIYIPVSAGNTILLEDLFEYILPVGWGYSIIRAAAGNKYKYSTPIITSTLYTVVEKDTDELDVVAKLTDSSQAVESTSTRVIPPNLQGELKYAKKES